MHLSQSLQAGDEQAALSVWRALMALPERRGVEIARQVIDAHSAQQAVLERVLARYAQIPGLSDAERYELFLYAIQWRQDALADTLLKGIGASDECLPARETSAMPCRHRGLGASGFR